MTRAHNWVLATLASVTRSPLCCSCFALLHLAHARAHTHHTPTGLLLRGWLVAQQIGFVASFCSKLSDTVSSEVGKAYGRTTYLVTTLERVPRGTEGAVSLEGTLAGMAAALAFSAVALAAGQVRHAREEA